MAETLLLKPDRKFVEELIAAGGGDLKKCYQCATCSVACELSNAPSPFPRKEMIWAQWGLQDRLVADPDVWLCHQCNDCSQRCPRGARPGDVLAAVRQKAIQHYAVPGFLASWVNSVRHIPVMLVLVPAILLALALLARGPIEGALGLADPHHAFYAAFFPHWLLIGFYTTLTTLAFLGLVVGLIRFWGAMKAADRGEGRGGAGVGFVPSVIRAVTAILAHNKFGKCTDQANRRLSHLMAFYGFIALFIVTVWATMDLYLMPHLGVASLYPFGLAHPMKILANIGGVFLVAGCIKAILDRRRGDEESPSTSFDWIFVWLLLLVAVTGFVTEVFRFVVDPEQRTVLEYSAYSVYFVHLVCVFGLLVYLPYSKFAHLWYRTVAMIYAEYSGRTREGAAPVPLTRAEPAPEPAVEDDGFIDDGPPEMEEAS
jgi:quinone-modifying oxidoreductase subunit QmoC